MAYGYRRRRYFVRNVYRGFRKRFSKGSQIRRARRLWKAKIIRWGFIAFIIGLVIAIVKARRGAKG